MITKSINKTLILSAVTALLFSLTTSVSADTCVTQYGGSQYGTACAPNDLIINKEVQKIGYFDENRNPIYVENLSITDTQITPGNYMTFRLTIKNNSSKTFSTVEVKDIFPPYLSYVSGGPSGTVYDAETRTMTSKLYNVAAGETRVLTLVAKIDEEKTFPAGKSSFCVVNTGKVTAEDRSDEDTAQVCIKTPDVKGVTTTTLPKAGFNDILMIVPAALLGLAGLGLVSKKI